MTTACTPSSSQGFSQSELRDMIAHYTPHSQIPKKVKLITDTSDFFKVDYHDVLILDDHPYLIKNSLREGRFGIDEEPKYWVKKAVDLANGNARVSVQRCFGSFQIPSKIISKATSSAPTGWKSSTGRPRNC